MQLQRTILLSYLFILPFPICDDKKHCCCKNRVLLTKYTCNIINGSALLWKRNVVGFYRIIKLSTPARVNNVGYCNSRNLGKLGKHVWKPEKVEEIYLKLWYPHAHSPASRLVTSQFLVAVLIERNNWPPWHHGNGSYATTDLCKIKAVCKISFDLYLSCEAIVICDTYPSFSFN